MPRGGTAGVRTWRQKWVWFIKDQEKAPGWLALISQEEEAKTEGEHIRGKLG